MPYADLLPSLIANQMVVVTPGRIFQFPFPRWYNPNATCAYHGSVPGHSIEQCMAFKHKVQGLIDAGWLTFQKDGPNIKTNPLVRGPTVNAVADCRPQRLKQMKDVVTSRRFILKAWREEDIICFDGSEEDTCFVHPGAAHDEEACPMAEDLLQRIMDQGCFEVCCANKGEQHVCMQLADKSPSKPKPLVIHFTKDSVAQKHRGFRPIPVKKPVPFPY